MEINHETICIELRRWASATKRETVAAEIAQRYFELGGGDLPLYPVDAPCATHNNMQNLFRWLDSDSRKARVKINKLKPAIIRALELRLYGTIQYQIAQAQKECAEAISATLLELPTVEKEINDAIEALYTLKNRSQRGIYCR